MNKARTAGQPMGREEGPRTGDAFSFSSDVKGQIFWNGTQCGILPSKSRITHHTTATLYCTCTAQSRHSSTLGISWAPSKLYCSGVGVSVIQKEPHGKVTNDVERCSDRSAESECLRLK